MVGLIMIISHGRIQIRNFDRLFLAFHSVLPSLNSRAGLRHSILYIRGGFTVTGRAFRGVCHGVLTKKGLSKKKSVEKKKKNGLYRGV